MFVLCLNTVSDLYVDHLNRIYTLFFPFPTFHSPLQVVNISDSNGGQYKIAMNSAIEFGVLYNPSNDIKSAQVHTLKHNLMSTYTFHQIS